jgi:hypothetical protein
MMAVVKDKFKIEALFDALDVDYHWETQYQLVQGNRTFRFNTDGEVIDVKEDE